MNVGSLLRTSSRVWLALLAHTNAAAEPVRGLNFGSTGGAAATVTPQGEPDFVIPKLGILNLDGYYYPTQPGDVNDLRTWCHVAPEHLDDKDYQCQMPLNEGEFGAVFATVTGTGPADFTFAVSTNAVNASKNRKLIEPLKYALKYLLERDDVKAITCSVGFCAELQPMAIVAVHELMNETAGTANPIKQKPMLLGSPALTPLFTDAWPGSDEINIDDTKEKIIVLTSYYPGLDPNNLNAILDSVGIDSGVSVDIFGAMGVDDSAVHNWTRGQLAKLGTIVPNTDHVLAGLASALRVYHSFAFHKKPWELPDSVSKLGDQADWKKMDLRDREAFRKVANSLVVIGWNEQEGYIPVDQGGGFHNVWQTLRSYADLVNRTIIKLKEKGYTVKAIIMESTEMPAHANKIRMDFGLPVFTTATVGRCLMQADDYSPSNIGEMYHGVFYSEKFNGCVAKSFNKDFREHLFGTQPDGSLKFYENLPDDVLESLTCNGGRPPRPAPPIGRLMEVYDPGHPFEPGGFSEICHQTALCRCEGVPKLGEGCLGWCPGSGNCGGGKFGQHPNSNGTKDYACGVRGEKCTDLTDVPPLIADPNSTSKFAHKCSKKGKTNPTWLDVDFHEEAVAL